MIHQMKLHPAPMDKIRTGQKIYELRLWDEKRRQLTVGDTICFTNSRDDRDSFSVRVVGLHRFDSFAALYAALPLLRCGYTEDDVASARPEDMDAYYSREEQRRWGVVAIEVALI